jgi:hypothetical protein
LIADALGIGEGDGADAGVVAAVDLAAAQRDDVVCRGEYERLHVAEREIVLNALSVGERNLAAGAPPNWPA